MNNEIKLRTQQKMKFSCSIYPLQLDTLYIQQHIDYTALLQGYTRLYLQNLENATKTKVVFYLPRKSALQLDKLQLFVHAFSHLYKQKKKKNGSISMHRRQVKTAMMQMVDPLASLSTRTLMADRTCLILPAKKRAIIVLSSPRVGLRKIIG